MTELDSADKIKLLDELRKCGFCKDLYTLRCKNTWEGDDGLTKECPFETDPGLRSYIISTKPICPLCDSEKQKNPKRANISNFALTPYIPLLISLRCGGIKEGRHLSGGIKREMCGEYMGTDWHHNFKKKLRSGELKCKCGSKRFVKTDRDKSQTDLFIKLLNEGRFPRLKKLLDDILPDMRDVKKVIQELN